MKKVISLIIMLVIIVGGVGALYLSQETKKDQSAESSSAATSVLISDEPVFMTTSNLENISCLENSTIKACFDDNWGGTFSGVYRKDFDTNYNFLYPTAGGSLQVDLRSKDVINTCPGLSEDDWLYRWNPTQAGCEACWVNNNGSVAYLTSNTANKVLTNERYSIDIWPRNYFHHNVDDCNSSVNYTKNTVLLDEDIFIHQEAQMYDDYLQVNWKFQHTGNHTHELDSSSYYFRQELPTFYVNDSVNCFELAYKDVNGNTVTKSFPCKKGTDEFIPFQDGWLSFYDPNNNKQALTISARNTVDKDDTFETTFRNYYSTSNRVQLDFSSFFNIEPNMNFEVEFIILPYKWNETMADGQTVINFIENFQNPASLIKCTNYTYGEWGECINGKQTRTIVTFTPAGCTERDPLITQACGSTADNDNCVNQDSNNDKKISLVDLSNLLSKYNTNCEVSDEDYGTCGSQDSNNDGKISLVDLSNLLSKYNKSCE